jgi:Arc/MetJ-type ribon-helix-helix transcriptional regulator
MEIRPSPNQEALIRQAIEAGRFEHPEDAVKEALALWEERERARAEFRETLDEAEISLARGEGTEITRDPLAMRPLARAGQGKHVSDGKKRSALWTV